MRLGGDDHQVGKDTVGDVGLGAIQQPVISLVLGARLHAGKIGAGVRLGHRDRHDGLAADQAWQEALLLLLGAEVLQVGRDQTAMQRDEIAAVAVRRVLLDQDLLVAEVLQPEPAVLLVGPHAQVAGVAGLPERLAVHDAGRAPALGVRADLGLEELSRRIAEEIHFGIYGISLHIKVSGWKESVAIRKPLSTLGSPCVAWGPSTLFAASIATQLHLGVRGISLHGGDRLWLKEKLRGLRASAGYAA